MVTTVSAVADNRLIAARNEFANAFGDLARGKRNWQLVAVWTLVLLTILLVAFVQLARSARVVPYIVTVDRAGRVLTVEEARTMRTPERRLVAAQLAGFVRAVRGVLPATPPQLEADVMRRAYAFVDQASPAAGVLNAYFADPEHDPRVLGARLTRMVEVTAVLPVPNASAWQLQWQEIDTPLQASATARTTAWEGYATIRIRPPMTAEALEDNPLGLFVTTFVWTEITDPSLTLRSGDTP
jgi:type IV secretion system protein VirB5